MPLSAWGSSTVYSDGNYTEVQKLDKQQKQIANYIKKYCKTWNIFFFIKKKNTQAVDAEKNRIITLNLGR